ncbi:MAG: ABC transporter ATP-binding protein [Xenococcaceae cyanobacterium]
MTISVTKSEVPEKPQDKEVVLSVQGVSKKFCRDLKRSLFYGVQDIASDLTGLRTKSDKLREKEFWALDNVSFELKRGEALGLVGKNGSGKSTLLRIIAGLIKPDLGTVEITGRVAPLIALGAGFNPILTGRENIYANMAILGLSKQEIDERFDDVVEFAEIGDAIDAPVQTYSSGMAARLGFACAIHTEPDILLVDEVLAVGDIKFKGKCTRKLAELREKGTSFILVTHNSSMILYVCKSAVYLSQGKTLNAGLAETIVRQYEEDMLLRGTETSKGILFIPEERDPKSQSISIEYLCFKDRSGNILESPISGEYACFCIGCRVQEQIDSIALNITIKDIAREGETILDISSFYDGKFLALTSEKIELQLEMPCCSLRSGAYDMRIIINKLPLPNRIDQVESYKFKVEEKEGTINLMSNNLFYQPREWRVVDV